MISIRRPPRGEQLSPANQRRLADAMLTRRFSIAGILIGLPGIGLACWLLTGLSWLLPWTAAALVVSLARGVLTRAYRRNPGAAEPRIWILRLEAILWATSILAGLLTLAIPAAGGRGTELLIGLGNCVVVSSAPLRGVLRGTMIGALYCALGPLAAMLLLTGEPLETGAAVLILVNIVTLRSGVIQMHALTIGMMTAGEERNRLLEQLVNANTALSGLANTDGLTGLFNRRAFDAMLEREWARARREGRSIGLLLLDLDHFKTLNDTMGHAAGDDALRRAAAAIGASVHRPADIVARYGGEEFAVILPETGPEGALAVAEAARAAVEALNVAHPASPLGHLTVSTGAVAMPVRKDADRSALIEAADRALYDAKSEGRNRVVLRSVVPHPALRAA